MSGYVTLLGAEQVQSAANTMRAAAEEMSRAASSIDHSLQQHRQFMDDWLSRFEAAVASIARQAGE